MEPTYGVFIINAWPGTAERRARAKSDFISVNKRRG
jgi:hypothetical protein